MIARELPIWYALSLQRRRLPDGAVFSNYSRDILVAVLKSILDARRYDTSRRVVLPRFVCNTLVDAVLSAGGDPTFHELDADLTPRLVEVERQLEDGAAAWIVVDYFGMQPEIPPYILDKARGLGCRVIYDGAHSFLGLMTNSNRALAGFDYNVFSIYKALTIGTGAIGIGPVAIPHRVSLSLMLVMAARKAAKHALAPIAGGRLINRGMETLRREAPSAVSTRRGSAVGTAVLRFLAASRNYSEIASHAAETAARLALAARTAGVTPVFDDIQRSRNVLQGFPVRFESQADRDRMIAHFRRRGIDAYTWPTFSTLAEDAALWSTLLVLPMDERVANALETLAVRSRPD